MSNLESATALDGITYDTTGRVIRQEVNMSTSSTVMALRTEVDRILTSPYPVALQTLAHILKSDEDGSSLNAYATSNPCKIKSLVFEVVNALETWPSTITVLNRLSTDPTFRRCILQEAPETLHSLLTEATNQTDPQLSAVCMLLLSEPLPMGIPLPNSAQHFFVQVVKEAIGDPSAATLWRVYDLLVGACHQLPQILPQENWISLEEELTHIVRSARTLQDQSISLICFGIIYALAIPAVSPYSSPTEVGRPHGSAPLKSDAARDFFSGNKAHKSLNLAALQVTWCCKPNVGVTHGDALKLLGIALDIFRTVERGILEQWSKGNEGETNIRRMLSKLMEPGLNIELQLQLSALLATVGDFCKLPHQAMTKIERVVAKAKSVQSGNRRILKPLTIIFTAFAHRLSDDVVTTLIRESLLAAIPSSTNRSIAELAILESELQLMANCASQHPALRKRLLTSFTALGNDSYLSDFLREDLCWADCGRNAYCELVLTEGRRRLGSKLASLYLKTLLLSRSEESSALGNVSLTMLEKLHNLSGQSFGCPDNSSRSIKGSFGLHLVSQASIPREIPAVGYWKDTLRAHAQAEAKSHEAAMVRLVGNICHDLEQRCQIAEEPFRQEQKKTEGLQCEVLILRGEKNELHGQLVDRDMLLESLEVEKTETEENCRTVQLENDQLLDRIEKLEQSLRDANSAAETEIQRINTESEAKELNLRAELAARGSIAEDLENQITEAERQNGVLEADLVSARRRASDLEDNHQILETDLRTYERELESEKKSRTEIETTQQQAQEECKKLSLALDNSRKEYEAATCNFNEQRSRHESELAGVKIQMEQLESTHKASLQTLAVQLVDEQTTHASKIVDALAQFDEASEEVSRLRQIVERNDAIMSNQQHQITQLKDNVTDKEREIAEFQTMRQTLAAALGQNVPDRKHTRKNVRHNKGVGGAQHSPIPRRRSTRLGGNIDVCQSTYDDQEEEGNRSSESTSYKSGSTPKRAKPRQPFKVPEIRQPRLNVATARSAKLHEHRLPLRDVSSGRANLSPIRPTLLGKDSPIKQDDCERNRVEDEVDLEFESDVLFTSTPFTPMAPAMAGEVDDYNDTTLDE